jgi:hypothetical protein
MKLEMLLQGLLPEGNVYNEVGIAHITMRCKLI